MTDPSALNDARKASRVYLLLVLGSCYGLGVREHLPLIVLSAVLLRLIKPQEKRKMT